MASFGQWQKSQAPKSGFASFIAKEREKKYSDLLAKKIDAQKQEEALNERGRSLSEIAGDTGRGVISGGVGLVKTAGDLAALTGAVDPDNIVSELAGNAQDYYNEGQSDYLKLQQRKQQAAIDSADSLLGKAGAAIESTLTNPALLVDMAAKNAASLGPAALAGRGAVQAATKLGVSGAAAGKVGLGAAIATGAAQQGTDVAMNSAYEAAMNQPQEKWDANPAYVELVKTMPPEEAKKQLALSAARAAFVPAAALSAGAQFLPGGQAIERALVGKAAQQVGSGVVSGAVKGALGEGFSEGVVEEGGGQVAANLAQRAYTDPAKSIEEGVGQSIGLGTVGGAVFGGPAGALNGRSTPAPPKPTVPAAPIEQPVSTPAVEPVTPVVEPDYIPSQADIDFDERASTEAYARATIEAEAAAKKAEQLRKKAEITATVAQETNSPIAIERATKAQAEYDTAQNDALQKTAAIPQIEVDPKVLRDTKKLVKEKEAISTAVAKEREAVLKAETVLPPVRKIETIDPATAYEAAATQTIEPVTVTPVDAFEKGFNPYAQDDEITTRGPNVPTTLPRTAPRDEKIAEFRRNKGLEYSRAEPTYGEALTELASRKDAFSTPIPQGNTTAEMAKSVFPTAETFDLPPQKGIPATGIVIPEVGETAYIFESPDRVWIDVSELQSGQGGEGIYRIASARANATGKKFVPDPNGMSELAKARRPELMLSEGAKHGSFDFLEPGDQVQNYEPGRKADALAEQNVKTVLAAYPEIADIVTDGEKFINAKTGETISDDTFKRLAAREPLPDVLDGYRAGSRTLKRTAFLNTFSPGRRGTFGVAALAKLRERTDNALPESLQRFLYSRGTDKVDGITRARAERAVDRALGAGTFTRAIKSGKVKIHANPAAIGADANAAAAYERDTDTIHLFASNLDEKTVAGKFLHEYTHRGFQEAVGGAKSEAEIFARFKELADNGDVEAKNAYRSAAGEANVDREALAYFMENRQNKPVPKSLFDALSAGIRKGLRLVGVKLKESDSDFKSRIYEISRKSLRAQIQADTKRQEGTRELNEPVRDVDFSGIDKRSAFVNESMKTLIDQNFVFEEMNRIIQDNGGSVSDSTNIAQRLNTRGSALGEISDRINRLKKDFTDKAIKLKVTLDDIGMWAALQDRAAYDAEVFERTGELNASGLTDAEAAAERARLEPQAKALQEMTDMITAIHQEAADVRFYAGLITAEERAKRRKTYVALRGHDNFALHDRSEAAVPGMYGKSVTGKEYRAENARKGRPNYREIAGHAFEDLTKSHARASWNKVVRTIMAFAVAHPNSGIFAFERPEFDAEGKPIGDVNDKVLYGKIKGKLYKVAITHPGAARAIMASAGAPSQAMQIISLPNKLMSYALTTGLTFAGKQIVIDNIEAYTTAVSEQGAKVANDMLKTQLSAISALWRYVNGKPDLNNDVDKKLQEFAQQGGITSFLRDEPASKITKELARKLEPTGIKKATLEELKAIVGSFKSGSEGKTFAEATGQFKDAIADAPGVRNLIDIAEFVSRATKVLENGVRFSFYLSMRKNKPEVTSERAAYLAKELTVNFDRKGELANTLGALFLFYKPIAQSARKTVRLAKNKTFWKLAAPALGAAFALGLMNAGFEDEEGNLAIDNVPDYERATGVIIMYGGGKGEYFRIPLPPGLVSIINQIGQGAATIATHSKRGDEKMIQRQLLDMGAGTYNAIAPSLEAEGTPSMGAWSVFNHLIRNKDQYGRPIYPENQSRISKPKSEQTRGDAGVLADTAAGALNYNKWINKGLELVGSSWQWKDEPPIAPLDWSPEEINYLVGSFMPAINKEILVVGKYGADYWNRSEAAGSQYAMSKAIDELGTLPVIKTFVGRQNEGRYYADFDRKRTDVNREQAQFKEIREKEGDAAAATFRDNSKTMAESMMNRRGLRTTGNDTRGRIRRAESDIVSLNKALKKWYNANELSDELIDSVSKEIDLSDVNTTDFRAYRTVVIDRVKEKMNKIRRESLRE